MRYMAMLCIVALHGCATAACGHSTTKEYLAAYGVYVDSRQAECSSDEQTFSSALSVVIDEYLRAIPFITRKELEDALSGAVIGFEWMQENPFDCSGPEAYYGTKCRGEVSTNNRDGRPKYFQVRVGAANDGCIGMTSFAHEWLHVFSQLTLWESSFLKSHMNTLLWGQPAYLPNSAEVRAERKLMEMEGCL